MSATYNWAYYPSIPNKYNFTVPAGADTARPTGWCYVALFGNDATGNGSRLYPVRTITKAQVVGGYGCNIVLGSGVYRETAPIASNVLFTLIGDGDVTIDLNYIGNLTTTTNLCPGAYNIKVIGNGTSTLSPNIAGVLSNLNIIDCYFNGASPAYGFFGQPIVSVTNTIFVNVFNVIAGGQGMLFTNCTFVNCPKAAFANDATTTVRHCIFVGCNVSGYYNSFSRTTYNLFFQCNFNFTGSQAGGAVYPSVPSGFAYYSTIAAVQAAGLTAYSAPIFSGCTIADPLFNNAAIGDYSLQFTSPAKNLSYFGTYVGAISLGLSLLVKATESSGSFDFSTNTNLTVADSSITFTNSALDGQIDTKPLLNSLTRIIQQFPLFGFNSDRNGQYVDSIPDLGSIKTTSDTLPYPSSWLVIGFTITYNGNTLQPGDRFTIVTGVFTFTSGSGGTVQEIVEAPERHTIMARFMDGGTFVTVGTALVSGYWYFVVSGSVTYDTVTYTANQYFKAVDTNAFTGTGVVEEAFPIEATLAFQHYDPIFQPMSNNVGNVRTGAIVRGNGDPAYVRGTGNEWPINSKHMQFRYFLRANNLTP
jgi:hypothetical protein